MELKMWMLDVAREQAPTLEHLRTYARLSLDAGYDALGLYLEHRFAYPSTPWTHGKGAITPDDARQLQREFPSLQIVPFINLLGHMEGFLYAGRGQRFAEARMSGLQACPSNAEFRELCRGILDDTLAAFDSELVHIGGDETKQLGQCPLCRERTPSDIYADHFGEMAERVVAAGRRPGLWGDMFLEHPDALSAMPKNSLIFDWQYFGGLRQSAPKLAAQGHEIVGCPALHTYNAVWLHLERSEQNVREVATDVREMGLHGVCVTTWECTMFTNYDTLFPAIRASGALLSGERGDWLEAYEQAGAGEWAKLMGVDLEKLGGVFAFSGIRSGLKVRLLLMADPFKLHFVHGEELLGEQGRAALAIAERALHVAPSEEYKVPPLLLRAIVEFATIVETAKQEFEAGRPESAVASLAPLRGLFEDLAKVAARSHERIGASLADVYRCRAAIEAIERVIRRIREFGAGELGYVPAWDVLAHPMFIPHDQGCWWLINKFAH